MNARDLRTVLDRYPELKAGVPEHLDEVIRIAARILKAEPTEPIPWAGLPDDERTRAFDATYPPRKAPPTVVRLTLTPIEAAAALGVSRDYFDQHVKPDLRLVRRGRLVLIPVSELERWVRENAGRTVE